MEKKQVLEAMFNKKMIPVVRENNFEEAKELIEKMIEGKLDIIEMTYTNPDASKVIKYYREKNVLIGAGSILNEKMAIEAINSGSLFIVGPNYDQKVAELCQKENILYIPGCLTPTEITNALNNGIDFIKLFPGSLVGFDYIKAIRGPLPNVKIMVTGGVELNNVNKWLDSGANCVGLGSVLTKDRSKIVDMCKEFINIIKK